LKSLTTGKVLENTFNGGSKIITARVERKAFQYLYKDDLGYHFMDSATFEQIHQNDDLVLNPGLMKEGQEVELLFHAEKETTLTCELPAFVKLEVSYTEPGIKGDTATNALKVAKLETGEEIKVPLFIEEGEMLKIDTRSNSYVERVKK